jgi:SAM-dependent methyltransferase
MDVEREAATKFIEHGMSLLDVGCGPGRDAKFWSDRGVRVTGVDACPEMIARAKADYPQLRFQVGDILTLDISEVGGKPFDGAWLAYILLHLPPDLCRRALSNVRRIVRTGGVVFIATTISPLSRHRLGPIAGLKDSTGRDIEAPTYEWSLDNWARLVRSFGFVEKWSRVTDFMSGKSTVLSAIYSPE